MGWRTIDSLGNTKLSTFGSGASLPDPVTVAHGGTGLITVSQGDLLYSDVDGSIARLAKASTGTRILTNQGTNHAPQWTDPTNGIPLVPRASSRKSAWTEAIVGSTTPATVIWTSAVAASSAQSDTTSNWLRYSTSNVSGNTAGYRSNTDLFWLDHSPLFECAIRLTQVTNVRVWFVLSNVGAANISNSDDQHLLKGAGFRFSSTTDTKWVPWTADGTTQTIGTGIVTPVASTVYTLSCSIVGTTATMTVNADSTTAQSVTIGAGALGTAMRLNLQITTKEAAIKDLDITSIYGEWA